MAKAQMTDGFKNLTSGGKTTFFIDNGQPASINLSKMNSRRGNKKQNDFETRSQKSVRSAKSAKSTRSRRSTHSGLKAT